MPEVIEIEGGLARFKTVNVTREVPLDKLMPLIETRVPIATPLLPDRTRMFRLDPTETNEWHIEVATVVPPLVRTISVYGEEHRLSMPYTIFVSDFFSGDQGGTWVPDAGKAFFAKEDLTEQTLLIAALLPNIAGDGDICFGTTGTGRGTSLAAQIDTQINNFWLSDFTHGNREPYLPGRRESYGFWEDMTEDNPGGWVDWPEFSPDDTYHKHYTINEVFEGNWPDRKEMLVTDQSIPELRVAPTFGMAEQWFDALDPTQRFRLFRGMENYVATHGDGALVEPEPLTIPDEAE